MSLSKPKYNHMIVWLDENVASPKFCKILKEAFATTTNPESGILRTITEQDISSLIREGSQYGETTFLDVPFVFKLFSQIDPCLRYLLENSVNMRIFFITSGALGETIVPRILKDHSEIFKDENGKIYEDSIYIFCANIVKHSEWAFDYEDEFNCIKMDNDDRAMLARITRDIAKYFVSQAEALNKNNDIYQLNHAKQYLNWATQLYIKADSVRKMPSTLELIAHIDQSIKKIEENIEKINTENNNDDDMDFGEQC